MVDKVAAPADITDALADLAQSRRASLAALARSEGLTAEDAVDCVQEGLCTFLGMARASTLPADEGEWASVLAGIVRNVARNRRRRHFAARPHVALGAHEDERLVPPDALMARAQDHVRLHVCVEELCAIQKAVVTLRMLEEKPGEDVAAALGITPGHVAVLLHRAKNALRVCMTES